MIFLFLVLCDYRIKSGLEVSKAHQTLGHGQCQILVEPSGQRSRLSGELETSSDCVNEVLDSFDSRSKQQPATEVSCTGTMCITADLVNGY